MIIISHDAIELDDSLAEVDWWTYKKYPQQVIGLSPGKMKKKLDFIPGTPFKIDSGILYVPTLPYGLTVDLATLESLV